MRNRRSLAVGLTGILALIASLQSPAFPQAAGVGGAPAPDINPPVTNCNPNTDTFVDTSGEFKPTPITDELLTLGTAVSAKGQHQGTVRRRRACQSPARFRLLFMAHLHRHELPGRRHLDQERQNATPGPSGKASTIIVPLPMSCSRTASQPDMGHARWSPNPASSSGTPDKIIFQLGEEAFNQPFKTGPLIDQDGNYALFDILMNKPMFDYILTNEAIQQAGSGEVHRGD